MTKKRTASGKAAPRSRREKRKPPAPVEQAAREEKGKLARDAIRQRVAAKDELRKHAAEWLAIIRNRLAVLHNEVAEVLEAARADGSVLGELFDLRHLNEVCVTLSLADNSALLLNIAGEDLPIPRLLAIRDRICGERISLAEAGA